MTGTPWRVAVLEDDTETRTYFEACIAAHSSLSLSASFSTLALARTWFAHHTADVLLTDLSLPDGHGLILIREVAKGHPACEILVVSVFGDEDSVLACVQAGAVGYIQKDTRPADVAQTILDVKQGASPISPMIARKLLARLRTGAAPAGAVVAQPPTEEGTHEAMEPAIASLAPTPPPSESELTLTPREVDVLELVARGYAYAEIAALQAVSIHTVQSHIKHLYAKLAVHSRSEAVFEASRMGLLRSMKPGL